MPITVPPAPGPSLRSANMRANQRRDTGPERRVRSLLHASGLRFRVDLPVRVGTARPIRPDIVFTRLRLAIFLDGCFWHGCPEHGRRVGGSNTHYWGPKIARNRERDAQQEELLAAAGWTVLRFLEHEEPGGVAAAIEAVIAATRQAREPAATPPGP